MQNYERTMRRLRKRIPDVASELGEDNLRRCMATAVGLHKDAGRRNTKWEGDGCELSDDSEWEGELCYASYLKVGSHINLIKLAILYTRDEVLFHHYTDTFWCVEREYIHKAIGVELDTLIKITEEWIMLAPEATRRWNLASKDGESLAYNLCRDYAKHGRCRNSRCCWLHLEHK